VRVEILGSGGATTTPRPGCSCRICVEARELGPPYARTGPSLFVHGPDVLIDTPEESKQQLDRSTVTRVPACLYSHWHPDHTLGRRVFESLNAEFRAWPRQVRGTTRVYLPEQVATDFRERLGGWEHLEFMAGRGWIEVVELADGETLELDGASIMPFRVAEDYVYAFLLEADGRRLLVAPDELRGWSPPDWVLEVDAAVLPMGVCEHHPFTGERRIPADHPVLRFEATFAETLEIVAALGARRVVLSHIEELDGLSHDELVELGRRHGVEFAWDGMLFEV
jgi:phosphoribosyl 1,2-cyclic phosphate phosphodiesterase